MTSQPLVPRLPGHLPLRLARLVFDDTALAMIIEPAIADLQCEIAAAGPRAARIRALVRGYLALVVVMAMAALLPGAGAGAPVLRMVLGANGGFFVVVLAPLLFAVLWPTLGVFASAAAVAGTLFSFIVRAWNDRHPVTVARRRAAGKEPEINLAGIPVGGDMGGFLFVIASVVMILGLPGLRAFVMGATAVALLLACGLLLWRRHDPHSPVRRIIGA